LTEGVFDMFRAKNKDGLRAQENNQTVGMGKG
jgi:hypothetical protein